MRKERHRDETAKVGRYLDCHGHGAFTPEILHLPELGIVDSHEAII